ncbi:hypothetical protein GALL_501210 [mine drainage metagenome]|uniref:Uncharacterized protein n=1 Tax=mine drainage metagenome TaxID=410659 RepID=A0A1J5PSM2_9ZZZZ
MPCINRLIDVGQRLCLDTLRGIDHQQRPLHRAHRAADFVAKVNVAGRVDQVQHIGQPVVCHIINAHRVRLDGNPAFPLDIHTVQQLLFHVARGDSAGRLDQPVSKRGFTVVDMRHDGEIADLFKFGHGWRYAQVFKAGQAATKGPHAPFRLTFPPLEAATLDQITPQRISRCPKPSNSRFPT